MGVDWVREERDLRWERRGVRKEREVEGVGIKRGSGEGGGSGILV